tara:strand:- start:557 stop:772 length:216 start_codon:yes stop_codon:yes gene_type:complete
MFGTEINESYLDRIYEDFSKEQTKLMEQIKGNPEQRKEQDITKQITQLNTLMMSVLRFRNLKRKIALKMLE